MKEPIEYIYYQNLITYTNTNNINNKNKGRKNCLTC